MSNLFFKTGAFPPLVGDFKNSSVHSLAEAGGDATELTSRSSPSMLNVLGLLTDEPKNSLAKSEFEKIEKSVIDLLFTWNYRRLHDH